MNECNTEVIKPRLIRLTCSPKMGR